MFNNLNVVKTISQPNIKKNCRDRYHIHRNLLYQIRSLIYAGRKQINRRQSDIIWWLNEIGRGTKLINNGTCKEVWSSRQNGYGLRFKDNVRAIILYRSKILTKKLLRLTVWLMSCHKSIRLLGFKMEKTMQWWIWRKVQATMKIEWLSE